MSEAEQIAALRDRLSGAETSFELTRCHFEAHALLRRHPGSVEGRLLLEQIERKMRALGAETPAPPAPRPPSPLRLMLRPLPWVVGLAVVVYLALYLLRRFR